MNKPVFFSAQYLKKKGAAKRLARYIVDAALSVEKHWDDIVVLCIGTDRSTGDSYGPLTGYLMRACSSGCRVAGTVKKPVHAENLQDTLASISACSLVIAVDSAVGLQEYIGGLAVKKGPLLPGSGVGKKLPPVGDVSVKGFVAESGGFSLMGAPLGMVFGMAEVTAKALKIAARELNLAAAREAVAGSILV